MLSRRAIKNDKDNKPEITLDRPETELYYNMLNKKRGVAVILNHVKFMSGQSKRTGTEKDLESLKQTLKKLSFDVRDYTDLRKRRIVSLLKRSKSNYYIKIIQNKKILMHLC